ncbi:DUF6301 family protein [Actinomadura sp. NEAU-AAG7]|uniref:DUF6301 family protein n=1 Tax=Actinomadura sp. NEAU-AAG7 TaxID=2839640 RepID=UPI001BE3F1F4|nr:DUF6301 family protein [Actinomadura sp. NEAU-AAG7]MBT2210796.1 hypothetical protein [Actinomadura sp. NEAU-AAG7]
MSVPTRLDDGQIVDLARQLLGLRWSWRGTEVGGLVRDFGWTVEIADEGGVEFDIGLGVATADADIDETGRVSGFVIPISGYGDKSPESRAWLQDLFAHASRVLVEALGEPTKRSPGRYPEVRWRDDRATLAVTRNSMVVEVTYALNEYLDFAERYSVE